VQVRPRDAAGRWRWFEAIGNNLLDDPAVEGLVINSRDITERKRAERQLQHSALHDSLTDLPNRASLLRELDQVLAGLAGGGRGVAVLFFDLDQFKLVNDSMGHAVGDEVLVEVAERLRQAVGTSDTAARFGGDEFVVLCPEVEDRRQPFELAERIQRAMAAPFRVGPRSFHLSVSIGITITDRAGVQGEDLLRDADAAMYTAKDAGPGSSHLFDDDLRATVLARVETESELRAAAGQDELRLYYQPLVWLPDRSLAGAEALLRWQHPSRGLLLPRDFITVAEQSGLIVPLGAWALQEACRRAAGWQHGTVAVNLSASQLTDDSFPRLVADALAGTGLAPDRLCLEITESVIMDDLAGARAVLGRLKELGATLAVDDFGTGYSSLSYLRRLPVDILKIDQSFVSGLEHGAPDVAIVRAILELAQGLGLRVVAEGVETQRQHDTLVSLGCPEAQGFFYGRPEPAEEFERRFGTPELVAAT
jgi:diguanylate cyclase (GGDEF)-like protein